jgi:hypothetical protein
VQSLPSLHDSVFGVAEQPDAGLQAFVVQTLPSLQVTGLPAVQAPLTQISPAVQAFWSSHG